MTEVDNKIPEKMDASSTATAGIQDIDAESKPEKKPTEQNAAFEINDSAKDSNTEKEAEHKSVSKRVQEAREYNIRGRGRKYNDRGPPKDFKKNIKSDLTSQEESSDPVEIRKQVEFYFSDSNLLSDKFLYTKVDGPSNLPVPISIIHSFKRMRHFQPLSAVVAALKDSTTLDVVDNDACIKRKCPLPEEIKDKPMNEIQKVYDDKSIPRSIYAKGFGDEEPGTQFDIEAFFAEFGPTSSVRLRRAYDKTFKGSVFVEFDSEEAQKKFLALDPKPKWKGKDLLIKSKKQYCDDKLDDIEAGRIRPNGKFNRSSKDRRGPNRGGDDDRDWKVRRDEDRAGGYKDRNGRHKGFGSSGQRGRGRGGHGRDGDRRNGRDPPKEEKDEHNISVPTVRASTPSPTRAPKVEDPTAKSAGAGDLGTEAMQTEQPEGKSSAIGAAPNAANSASAPPTEASKKRHREDDEGPHVDGSATKKLDTKSGVTEQSKGKTTAMEAEPNSAASAPAPLTEASKKRHREDDEGAGLEGSAAKKLDTKPGEEGL